MHALVLVGLLAVAAPSDKPVGAKGAIKKADKIAAVITKHFDPSSDAYKRILETIRTAGSLDRPLKMSVAITSVNVTDKGSIWVLGMFRARKNNVGTYFTKEDRRAADEFRHESKHLDDQYQAQRRKWEAQERDGLAQYDHHHHASAGHHYDRRLSETWINKKAEHARQYYHATDVRRKQDMQMIRSLGVKATPRQNEFENIDVDVIIPPALAEQVNVAKLANAKRVLLTIDVQRFGLQQPIEEIGLPAAIGSITGTAVTITKSFLKKK